MGKSRRSAFFARLDDSCEDSHIHSASEEYQRAGLKEESFAEATKRYSNLAEAFDCLVKDCNVIIPEDKQLKFI